MRKDRKDLSGPSQPGQPCHSSALRVTLQGMAQERKPGEPLPEPYRSPSAAVGAEMARVALKIRKVMSEAAQASPADTGPFDSKQASRELSRLEQPLDRAPKTSSEELAGVEARLVQRARRNERDLAASNEALPLYELRNHAKLDPFAFDLFLLALAPEIDEGFGRVFGFLRSGTRRQLDVASAARVLSPEDIGAAGIRQTLQPGSPLFDLGLIELLAPDGGKGTGSATLTSALSVPPSVIAYVLGHPVHDPALRLFVTTDQPALPRERTFLPAEVFAHAEAILDDADSVLCLEGPSGSGKRLLLRTLSAERKRAVIEVDVKSAPGGLSVVEALAIVRLSWLRQAMVLLFLPPYEGTRPVPGGWQSGVADIIARYPGTVVLCRDTVTQADAAHFDLHVPPWRRIAAVEVPGPDLATREITWRDRLGEQGNVGEIDYPMLARTYPVTGGVITRISREARIVATIRGKGENITGEDVARSIEAEFRPKLQSIGRRLSITANFEDLVVADETRETLSEFEATVRLRHQVLDEWNFGKLVRGRGVSALFYGDPGTGKTMAAGVVAASCGLPLYQIDTAQVVSKWIGETEKNLSEVFRAAEAGHAMLLFDEADAIFGKRTDVQTSTDRYANMQTNFLLTQIETFNGVVILTTNRESVMDSAFQRRISFRVNFPMPEEKEREDLWRRMLSGHTGKADNINYADLAKRLRMSGGYIRNAVLRGAYLAAADGKPMTTKLLRRAAELVLRDAGRVI